MTTSVIFHSLESVCRLFEGFYFEQICMLGYLTKGSLKFIL